MAPYKVQQSTHVGRYIVAGKPLSAGEEVLSEDPFTIGPKAFSYLLCLGCYVPLEPGQFCIKCSWPICSEECSENIWHKENECQVFSKSGVKFQETGDEAAQLSCITPLRVLLSSERDPGRWSSEVEVLEGHLAARRDSVDHEAEQINIIHFLRSKCQLDRFSEEMVEAVCGLLEVNSFEVVSPTSSAIRGLYPRAAFLNHSCVANTAHSVHPDRNFRLMVRTTVGVAEGSELTCSYTSCLHPTMVRRARLRENKYFSCSCPRCTDPTELGTNMGTLKCTKCDNGIITSSEPTEDNAVWKCSHCENGVTGEGVRRVFQALQADIDQLEAMEGPSRLEATEKVLRSYKSVLHPQNGYNVMLWHSLSQLYGHTEGYTLDMLPDLLLERKSKFCKDLLQVLDVVEPGYTRIRGLTLYEYHVSLLMFARSQFQRGEISAETLHQVGQEVLEILEECVRILSLEPASSPEAFLANIASQSAAQLQESLGQLS